MESRLTKVVFTVSLFLMGTAIAQTQRPECYTCDEVTRFGSNQRAEECLLEQDANSTIIPCVSGICDSTYYTAQTIGAFNTYQVVRRTCALPGNQTGCTDDTAEIERREQEANGNQSLPFRILAGRQCHCSGNLCNNMSFELPGNECYYCGGERAVNFNATGLNDECLREQDSNSTTHPCSTGICVSTNYTTQRIDGSISSHRYMRNCALSGTHTGCTDNTAEIERQLEEANGNQRLPYRVVASRQCRCSGNLCNNMALELPANVQTQQECYHCLGGTDNTGTTIGSTDECLREQDSNSSTITCPSGICVFSNYSLESTTSSDGSVVTPRSITRTCSPPGTQIGCIDDAAEIERQLQQSSGDTTLRIRAGRQCYCSGDLCNSMPVEFSNAAWMRPDISLLAFMIIALIFHAF